MGEATGLGLVDVALLEAVDALTAGRKKRHVRTDRVLDAVEDVTGVASDEAYRVVCRMTQPWHAWLSPLDGQGNFGSEDDPAADAKYTEIGLSAVGVAALAAERGETGPLPIGLCNGSLAQRGRRPPLAPADVAACLRALAAEPGLSGRALGKLLPVPSSPNGCVLQVDTAKLWAGRRVDLTQRVRAVIEDGRLVITAVPLGFGPDRVTDAGWRAMGEDRKRRYGDYQPEIDPGHVCADHPEGGDHFVVGVHAYDGGPRRGPDCHDETDYRVGTRIVVTPGGQCDLAWVQTVLLERWPLRVTTQVQLAAPMAELMRGWATRCDPDVLERL